MKKMKMEELGRLDIEAYKKAGKIPVIIILDNVRSMHNVGSIFRSCDAFRVEKLILCGISPRPPHREINKTALGATNSVDWEYYEDVSQLINSLSTDYYICGMEQTDQSIPLDAFSPPEDRKLAVILGNEINGVGEHIINKVNSCIEIPQFGTKHSLNVSVAAGILLYQLHVLYNKKSLF